MSIRVFGWVSLHMKDGELNFRTKSEQHVMFSVLVLLLLLLLPGLLLFMPRRSSAQCTWEHKKPTPTTWHALSSASVCSYPQLGNDTKWG